MEALVKWLNEQDQALSADRTKLENDRNTLEHNRTTNERNRFLLQGRQEAVQMILQQFELLNEQDPKPASETKEG